MDIFHEETVIPDNQARAKGGYKRMRFLSWMFLFTAILFTILFFIAFTFIPIEEGGASITDVFLFQILPLLLMSVASYVLYGVFRSKKHNYLVDYDYTFVSGELRIAKVLNGIKRKGVAKISTVDISVIGKTSGDKFARYNTMPGIKKITATPNPDSQNLYFAFCTVKGQRSLLIFEPTEGLLLAIKRYSGRAIEWAVA